MRGPALALLGLALLAAAAAPAAPAPGPAPGEGLVPDEVVVGFHGKLPSDLEGWAARHGGALLRSDPVLAWASVKYLSAVAAERALAALPLLPEVRYAERDTLVEAQLTPNDPLLAQQWAVEAIELPAAWDLTLGSRAVKLAILDTGVHLAHPDLAPNLCGPFASFVPGEPTVDDQHGHGTHVAGIAAAATNNGLGIAGASQSCILAAKVLGRSGNSQGTSVALGIRWAADAGADIVSMSLGRAERLQATADAVAYAWGRGVLLVAAAGNAGCPPTGGLPLQVPPDPASPVQQNRGSILYPAFHDEVLAVAALTDPGTNVAGFSSCGPDMEVAAPGDGILSTLPPCGVASLCSPTGYGSLSGTSMAAPYVAGVAALVKAQNPGLSALALRCLLDLTADDLLTPFAPLPGRDHATGWGRVDARAALDMDAQLTALGLHGAFAQACEAGAAAILH